MTELQPEAIPTKKTRVWNSHLKMSCTFRVTEASPLVQHARYITWVEHPDGRLYGFMLFHQRTDYKSMKDITPGEFFYHSDPVNKAIRRMTYKKKEGTNRIEFGDRDAQPLLESSWRLSRDQDRPKRPAATGPVAPKKRYKWQKEKTVE